MAGNDFKVDTAALRAVGTKAQALYDDLTGANNFYPGALPDLQQKATSQPIGTALGAQTAHPMDGDGNGGSAFAGSYEWEHKALVQTYTELTNQLKALADVCTQTADAYEHHEQGAKQAVTANGTQPDDWNH